MGQAPARPWGLGVLGRLARGRDDDAWARWWVRMRGAGGRGGVYACGAVWGWAVAWVALMALVGGVSGAQVACVVPLEYRMGYYWKDYESWDPTYYYADLGTDYFYNWETFAWSDWSYSDFSWSDFSFSDYAWSDFDWSDIDWSDFAFSDFALSDFDYPVPGVSDYDTPSAATDSDNTYNAYTRAKARHMRQMHAKGGPTLPKGERSPRESRPKRRRRRLTERELLHSDSTDFSFYSFSDYDFSDYAWSDFDWSDIDFSDFAYGYWDDYYYEIDDNYYFYAYYMAYLTEGLKEGEMIGPTTGTCQGVLQGGASCTASCPAGHKPGEKLRCDRVVTPGSREAAFVLNQTDVCVERSCDASEAPKGGTRGNCTSFLPSGAHCIPSCPKGETVVGHTKCSKGVIVEEAICYNTYELLRASEEYEKLAPLAETTEGARAYVAAANTAVASSIGSSVAASSLSAVSSSVAAGLSSAISSAGLASGGIGLVALIGSAQDLSFTSHMGRAVPDTFKEISNSLKWANFRILPPGAPTVRPPDPEKEPIIIPALNATKPQRRATNITAFGEENSSPMSGASGATGSAGSAGSARGSGRVLLAVGDTASTLPLPTATPLGYWSCKHRFVDSQGFQMCEVWAQVIGLSIAIGITSVGHVALYFIHKSARRAIWDEDLARAEADDIEKVDGTENKGGPLDLRHMILFNRASKAWRKKAKVTAEDRSWSTYFLLLLGGDAMAAIVLPPNMEIMVLILLTPGMAEASGTAIGTGTDAGFTVGIIMIVFLCLSHALLSELLLVQLQSVVEFDEYHEKWRPIVTTSSGAADLSKFAARISLTGWYYYKPGIGILGLVLNTWGVIATSFTIGFFYSACSAAEQDDLEYEFESGCGTTQIIVVAVITLAMIAYKFAFRPLLDEVQAKASLLAQVSRFVSLLCLVAAAQLEGTPALILAALFVLFSAAAVMIQIFAEAWKLFRSLSKDKVKKRVAPGDEGADQSNGTIVAQTEVQAISSTDAGAQGDAVQSDVEIP